jgi:hypothetical protein
MFPCCQMKLVGMALILGSGLILLALAALLLGAIVSRNGGLDSLREGHGIFTPRPALNELPEQLVDFPLPDSSTIDCPCEPLPDAPKTLAVLVTTPLSPDDVIAFLTSTLPDTGFEITDREDDERQTLIEFVKDAHPGSVHVFANAGGETSVNIHYFTAKEP